MGLNSIAMRSLLVLFTVLLFSIGSVLQAQPSVARQWNEQLLSAISGDFARPTVHARNLFHISAAMYDAWAVYSPNADTYFLGKTVHGFEIPYHRIPMPADIQKAQEEAISFAAYRLLMHRYVKSPGYDTLSRNMNALMKDLGYDRFNASTNYKCGPAEMGNYIADKVIEYGLQDGSNEKGNYANLYYKPVNPPLFPSLPGNPSVLDINRWQPLQFTQFVDQSGHSFGDFITKFQSAEWGNVQPFALGESELSHFQRDGHDYKVYLDPGPPPLLDTAAFTAESAEFQWNCALMATWSSLLDPTDGVLIDISPASIGNNSSYPTDWAEMHQFYDFFEGGDASTGRSENPKTGQPYVPQVVPRGDYTRVLAEFWADGPRSVTPPGHWFEILNYVNDQPGLVRRIRGTGPLCDPLEWDVKGYFALGGAMHDAAITAWSIKGRYDATRPVNAMRAMAGLGQSSDPNKPHNHPGGLPLIPGFIELIQPEDPLQGNNNQHIGQVKIWSWKGPSFISDPDKDVAGVGWIRAENWWPYQRPTFVTPPFAGYISGHSTYSRAAAELLTSLTNDPYFPGGMGTFYCKKNKFLVFEEGPSQDITLQWATYRDASDECSLSRIYGGIHPPMDDIPGRLLGMKIGPDALAFAEKYFTKTSAQDTTYRDFRIFPNPTTCVAQIEADYEGQVSVEVYMADGRLAMTTELIFADNIAMLDLRNLSVGIYVVLGRNGAGERVFRERVAKL